MKRTFGVLIMLLLILQVFGARLQNMPVSITQPDGTEINVLASGDEFHNWLHDSQNHTIIQDKQTGWYTWAVRTNGELASSQYLVGQSDPIALNLEPGINLSHEQISEKYELASLMNAQTRDDRTPHFGTINNLVIFIRFSNSPEFTQNLTFFDNMFNNSSPDYNSMRNYFQAVSYNQLNITTHFYPIPNNTTIVCYVDSLPRAYYMPWSPSNPIGYDENDYQDRANREFTLLTNAANFVSTQIPPTLDLDGDDDGDVDNVCYIIQGTTTAWATLLWPHRWSIYNSTAFINGARVFDFNFQLENFLNYSGNSVLCHEMTHTLGAPDLYRYEDNTIDPVGSWDLMCGNTNPPQSMSAWMKYKYLSWVPTVPSITQSGTYTIHSVWSTTNNIYRIQSWKNNEYYVIEYRKPFGIYDGEIPGSGLLIYRLNTLEDGNAGGPPDELYIYRPGGTSNTINGNINMAHFSQQMGRTFMNETTSPNGFLSDEMPGGLDISQVSASGGETMSFYVNVSNVQVTYPKGGETILSGDTKTIRWKARSQVGNAKIEFSSNNGQTWQTIVASVSNTGSYPWSTVPIIDSDQCLIRITTLSNGAVDTCNSTFTVLSSIAVPTPFFPTNLMINAPTNPTFQWNRVQGAEAYLFNLALDSLFANPVLSLIGLLDTTYVYNNLSPFTTYYWQIASLSSVSISDYCPVQTFTTGQISIIPAVPVQILPANNATNQPLNALLRWNNADFAMYYHYQVAADNFFANLVAEDDSLSTSEIRLPALTSYTRYYWRVRSGNPAGYSNFSNIRYFTTGNSTSIIDNVVPAPIAELFQISPNPFNSTTGIEFRLKDISHPVKLTIYNLKGQIVTILLDGKAKSGVNSFDWDGKNGKGSPVASGIYYCKLETAGFSRTRKMVLMR